ncbi:MAG: MFS transporter [Propionibacteriaceae bacterium]
MRNDIALFRQLSRPIQLLLVSQFVFNVGFYLVVPFLAGYFEHDLHLAGAMIGLILGLRTFSQQGLFFLGGALTDWLGIKPIAIVGIAIRVLAFLTLAATDNVWAIILGVVLIGLAAALFSPACESAIIGLSGQLQDRGGPSRIQVLALGSVFSRAGSAIGPALGGLLFFLPFRATCVIAASIFLAIGLVHLIWLPSGLRVGEQTRVATSIATVLRHRTFLAFCLVNAVMLIAYNQMYLALPVELERSQLAPQSITWFFLLASLFVVCCQGYVTRITHRLGTGRAIRLGYVCTSAAFAIVAAVVWFRPANRLVAILPIAAFVIVLHVGSMIAGPRTNDAVALLAQEKQLGTFFGAMSSVSGIGVLFVSGPLGRLLEPAHHPGPSAVLPWLILAVLPLISAVAITPLFADIDKPSD